MEFLLTVSTATPKIALGSSPLFDLAVRNKTDRPAHFRYYKPTFWYPLLKDANGHTFTAVFPPYDGPAQPVDVEFKPWETRHFWSDACLFTDKPRGDIYVQVTPGKYSVRFEMEGLKSGPFHILVVAK